MKLYIIQASANKGINWLNCIKPYSNEIMCYEHKRIAKEELNKLYHRMKTNKDTHIARKYFRIQELEVLNNDFKN